MHCLVYRSSRYPDMYLYLAEPPEDIELPPAVRERVGRLEFALAFELTPERRLARADAARVLADIEGQGFYLQLPPSHFTGT